MALLYLGVERRIPMSFGERLRLLRKAAGMTQEKLARAADVSNATVFKLETVEGQDPSWSTVVKLARALGVSVAEFDVQEEPAAGAAEEEARAAEPTAVKGKGKKKGGAK
jgi:transcriptional regulator with XRE-family HTH domain